MAGWSQEDGHLGAKVAVLKALGNNPKLPFFAVLSQGFPRLVTVSTTALVQSHDMKDLPLGVHSRVMLNDDPASVPDLMSLELLIQKAMGDKAA
jgi:chemosensory pili system protein ChpC